VRETSGTVVEEIGRTREASATFVWEQTTIEIENDAAIDRYEGDQVVIVCVSYAMERKS
jgi:hypothetical protein